VEATGEYVGLSDESGWFFDDGYVFDFASAVAVAWHGSSAPAGDEYCVFDCVGYVVGNCELVDFGPRVLDEVGGECDCFCSGVFDSCPSGRFGCVPSGLKLAVFGAYV
jgi:hypothetical protein